MQSAAAGGADGTPEGTFAGTASCRSGSRWSNVKTRAFDGLDLARLSDLDLGFAVLGNLMQGARAEVASAAGDP